MNASMKVSQLDDLFTRVIELENEFSDRVAKVDNAKGKILECSDSIAQTLSEVDDINVLIERQLEHKAESRTMLVLSDVENTTFGEHVKLLQANVEELRKEISSSQCKLMACRATFAQQVKSTNELARDLNSNSKMQSQQLVIATLKRDIEHAKHECKTLDSQLQKVVDIHTAIEQAAHSCKEAEQSLADEDNRLEMQAFSKQLVTHRVVVSLKRVLKIHDSLERMDAQTNEHYAPVLNIIRYRSRVVCVSSK
eukprot:CFRG7097T1